MCGKCRGPSSPPIEEGLARHNQGHDPRTQQERTTDVDGAERGPDEFDPWRLS